MNLKTTFPKIEGKHYTFAVVAVLILISLIIHILPMQMYGTEAGAYATLTNQVKQNIIQKILFESPNLPASMVENEANKELALVLERDKDMVAMVRNQLNTQFQDYYRDANGVPYLSGIDAYMWYRQIRNLVNTGMIADEVRNGVQYNTYTKAPVGSVMVANLHHYVTYYLYIIMRNFGWNLEFTLYILPALVNSLAVIPAYLIGKRISNRIGGFISGLIIAVHPFILTKTLAGFSDTDCYVITFSLFITWLYLKSMQENEFKVLDNKSNLYAVICGIVCGVFSFAWHGWTYILYIIAGTSVAYFGYQLIFERRTRFGILWHNGLIIVCAIFVSYWLTGDTVFRVLSPMYFIQYKEILTLWPNVFTTVAEQNPASFLEIVGIVGGTAVFMFGFLGCLLSVFKTKKELNFFYPLLLLTFFVSTLYASLKGVRFISLLIIPLCIGFGVFSGKLVEWAGSWFDRLYHIDRRISKLLLTSFCVLMLLPIVKVSYVYAMTTVPDYNDGWNSALEYIRDNSDKNAIITSWWDFGHWFKSNADRRVTFDGASQNTPPAVWVGKALVTDNEVLSSNILRMLTCSWNSAFELAYNETGSEVLAMQKVEDMLITEQVPEQYKPLVQCTNVSNYFIVSGDMVGKSSVWSHFGLWNFSRASMYKDVVGLSATDGKQVLKTKYNLSDNQAVSYYYEIRNTPMNDWISPWLDYSSCGIMNETMVCPRNPLFENSMFTKLYFFDGINVSRFKQVYSVNLLGGTFVKVYELEW